MRTKGFTAKGILEKNTSKEIFSPIKNWKLSDSLIARIKKSQERNWYLKFSFF